MQKLITFGKLVHAGDDAELAREAGTRLAKALRDAIAQRGQASLALSGGNTPRPAYERLAKEPGIDWRSVSVFFIDERAVPPTHARSNYRLAKESLLDRAPIPAANVHRTVGEAPDLEKAARDYEAVLAKHGISDALTFARQGDDGGDRVTMVGGALTFDVAVMGVGDDGHTASLFPGEASISVRDRGVIVVPAAPEKGREARLTVTAPVIEKIGTVFVLAEGHAKRGPLARVWSPEGSLRDTPSRVLRSVEGDVVFIVDSAAEG